MHILNDIGFPSHQVPEALPLLRFCTDLANLVDSDGFFYSNDVRVIIDMIIRELYNLPFTCDTETELHGLEELRVQYIKFARALIAHEAWKSYNCAELRGALCFVVSETNNCAEWGSELLCWSRETAEEVLAVLETVY
jgi:hypothetical protein